ncbi:MAG: tRNA uridine-5-carboxymethylaminomethyl(34) synthesis GTPase MnmE [Paludibacteraceae bacterium]|nr:tRNA uridine-5-carboxymethylaminomethyl(34) synthesis GTPase MnmE [Paludibacteraceae bacterium]
MSTICAISTPYGSGGIAVVRVSGESAIQIVDTLFRGRKSLTEANAYTVHYGEIRQKARRGEEAKDEEILDQVLASVFRAPHSFTGEDVVEIACHGSMYIQQTLLQWLVDAGCQLAKAGEFTQRAFLNGKMDLTEAEAVADLIAAQTKAEKDLALSQLRGGISNELAALRERLLTFTSLVELELDFADHEELEFADRSELFALAQEIDTKIGSLVGSFKTGNAIKQGIPVAIIGAPNVGKSTLLNALLGEERAIVSDIQGTTRDTVEDTLVLGGMLFRFIDTAGMRQTDDTIESLGIERSRQAAQKAAVIIHLQDATCPINTLDWLDDLTDKKIIPIYNKVDLIGDETIRQLGERQEEQIFISAKSGDIEALRQQLIAFAEEQCNMRNAVTISSTRHYESLVHAQEAIRRVQEGLQMQISGEFLSMDLQDCLSALGEITGQITSQEVLNNIFGKFCIGK